MVEKKSLTDIVQGLTHLADRTPDMAFNGAADSAFAKVAPYRNGAISVGYYSGNTEWERHPGGDEIVMCIDGHTTVVLLANSEQQRIDLKAGELVVIPQGRWHRFENSVRLKVMGVTPEPTDHSLEMPQH